MSDQSRRIRVSFRSRTAPTEMSSKEQRKQAAAILGSAKTAKKAKAARENGFKPKRKSKLTKKIEKMISDEGEK